MPTPSRIGYQFSGWWTATNTPAMRISSTNFLLTATNHTLYAKWTANQYAVTFDAQGGSVDPTSKTVTFDAAYGALPAPARTGYTFAGWQASTNGVAFGVTSNTVVAIASDHTLSATWTANSYDVTFDAQSGTVDPAGKTVTFGAAYGALPVPALAAPVRVGYVFGGWFAAADCSGLPVTAETVVATASDHTLYAKWAAEPYLCDPAGDAPLAAAGPYAGYFYAETPFAGGTAHAVRGTFELDLVKTNGKFTAKAQLQSGPLTFAAKAWTALEADGTRRAVLAAPGGETLDLRLRQNRVWGSLAGGSLAGETLALDGARNRFADRRDAAAQAALDAFKGYYTVALPVAAAVPAGAAQAIPSGSGYLTFTVGSFGKVKIAGKLADGTAFSHASELVLFEGCGPEACAPFFVPLYARKGWAGGLLWLAPGGRSAVVTDRDLGWFVRWEKPAEKVDGASVLLDAAGGYYSDTPALAAHYLLTAETNAVPHRHDGGAAAPQAAALPDGVGVTFDGKRMDIDPATFPEPVAGGGYDYSAENCAMATLDFQARTGLFSGKFNLYYDYAADGRPQHRAVKVPYAGVLTPVRGAAFDGVPAGQGFYLVPDNDPRWNASPLKRSFLITLDEAP